MQKGSSKADMPTSSAAAPPLPTQLLCKHTHTHTRTHSRAEFHWNKGDQVLLTATITPLEKKAMIMFLWRAGEQGNRLSSDEDRPQRGENGLFISDQTFIGVLALFSIYNKLFEHILVGCISLSLSSLANHWQNNQ